MNIETLLTDPKRKWDACPPASDDAIEQLRLASSLYHPEKYFELLRYSNGGEGPLALPPLYFMLYQAEYAADLNQSSDQREHHPEHFVFGSYGGLEAIAFDMRGEAPWPIVMYDPVAGTESCVRIADTMEDFIQALGLKYEE